MFPFFPFITKIILADVLVIDSSGVENLAVMKCRNEKCKLGTRNVERAVDIHEIQLQLFK